MTHFCKLLLGAAILPVCLNAQELPDTAALDYERELDLNEVVVVANRPVMKHIGDGILYMVKNDPYAKGLNVLEVLDRVPRVSVVNEQVSIAGKTSVRYMLLDGRLTLSASVNDPFGWNIPRYSTLYDSYTQHTRNNIHSHAVSLRVVYNFGGNKVNNAYRDSKERESHRAY